MMKIKIQLLLFLLCIKNSYATEYGLTLTTGFGICNLKSKTFKNFVDEYNSVNASIIDKKLSTFKIGTSYEFGLNYYWAVRDVAMLVSFNYSRLTAKAKALLNSSANEKRMIKMSQDLWYVPVGLGKYMSNSNGFLYLGFCIPMGFRSNTLEVFYVYADGSRSYGLEKSLNGIYSNYAAVIGFQVHAEYCVSRFTFYSSINLLFDMFGKDTKFQDYGKLDAFMDDWEFGYTGSKVVSDFRNFTLNLGVGIKLFNFKL